MKELRIPVKYTKDDTLYVIKQAKHEVFCDFCEGEGNIFYKAKECECPKCNGTGKMATDKLINIVCEEPYIISTTKISINGKGNISVKHSGYCGNTRLNRSEDNLFLSKEDAQKRCDILNKQRVHVYLSDIIIQDEFKKTIPSAEKFQRKLDYYKIRNKFDSDIIINKENVLQDGYITYLLCNMLDISYVKVIVEDML